GREVEVAPGVGAAREALRLRPPAVVLLELDLPDGDASPLIEEARAAGAAVLVVTRRADPASVVRAMRLGARDFLAKPCRPEDLRAAVEAAELAAPGPVPSAPARPAA